MVGEFSNIDEKLEQLIYYYRRKILTGQISDGEQLPSVEALAERHGISESVATAIYEALAERGLVRQEGMRRGVPLD